MSRRPVVVDETNARAIYNYFNRFFGESRYISMADDPAVKKLWKNDVQVKTGLANMGDLQYGGKELASVLQAWVDKHIPMSIWKLCLHSLRQRKYECKQPLSLVRIEPRTKQLIKDCMRESGKSFDEVTYQAVRLYHYRNAWKEE